MTTTPSDEPQVPPTGATPPPPPPAASGYPAAPPPAPSGYQDQAPPPAPSGYQDQAPPPAGYGAPSGYAGAPAPGYQAPAAQQLSDSDQRMWATIAHIGPILAGFIAPLVIWLVFKERGRFVEEQSKEALNFQILVTIAAIVISIITAVTLGIGGILYLAFIVALVFMIMAAIAANKGEAYRYPVNLRLVK